MLPPNHELTSERPNRPWSQWFGQVGYFMLAERQSGTTANRPTERLWVGRRYFDTTLGKPVFYNGSAWVDGAGVVS